MVAKAIYETHRLSAIAKIEGAMPAPEWKDASEVVKQWVLAQADSAIATLDEFERDRR